MSDIQRANIWLKNFQWLILQWKIVQYKLEFLNFIYSILLINYIIFDRFSDTELCIIFIIIYFELTKLIVKIVEKFAGDFVICLHLCQMHEKIKPKKSQINNHRREEKSEWSIKSWPLPIALYSKSFTTSLFVYAPMRWSWIVVETFD